MRTRSSSSVLFVSVLSLGTLVTAQVAPLPQAGQPRDPAVQVSVSRPVPVGSATISGIVVTTDTGRPIRGARVTLNGFATISIAVGPGIGAADADALVAFGVPGGSGPASSLLRSVVTDAQGQFAFPRLPAGQFNVTVNHSQFLSTSYGQKRPGGAGTSIPLTDGQQLTITVPVSRGAAISGVVIGEDGEPVRNAQVRGWRFSMANGVKRLEPTGFASTDDRGMYRLYGLQPGVFVVSVTPNATDAMINESTLAQAEIVERAIASGRVQPPSAPGLPPTVSVVLPVGRAGNTPSATYLPTWAPSATAPSSAATVTVAVNEERTGIDIQVQPIFAGTIEGVVNSPIDRGISVQVSLRSNDPTFDGQGSTSTRVDPNGKFVFREIAPGTYTVFAQSVPLPNFTIINSQTQSSQPPPLTDAQKLWGKTSVEVNGPSTVDASLSLQPGRSISGIVAFDMTRPPDLSRTRILVSVSPAPSDRFMASGPQPVAQVGPDGRFTVTGVAAGRIILRASGGGQMKSSIVSGQDTLDSPLEFTGEHDVADAVLTLTDKMNELSGTILDSLGKPVADYSIIAAAADSRFWVPGSRRIAIARPALDGRFAFRTLPPGNYLLAAVTDLEPGEQFDLEFLRSLAGSAVPVTVMEGGKVTQDLRVR